MSTEQEPRAVAIKAAITAALPAGVLAYDADEVPGATGGPTGTLPARYVTVEISRRWEATRRFGGTVSVPGLALTTHYRAPNQTDARRLRDLVTEALENRAYDLPDGDTVGPFSFEFDGGLEFIAAGWSGFDSWTA